jgi:hypothetical protein
LRRKLLAACALALTVAFISVIVSFALYFIALTVE